MPTTSLRHRTFCHAAAASHRTAAFTLPRSAAVLLHRAIGDRFHAVMVDNGLLRKNERVQVLRRLCDDCGVNLRAVDASDRFLDKLKGARSAAACRRRSSGDGGGLRMPLVGGRSVRYAALVHLVTPPYRTLFSPPLPPNQACPTRRPSARSSAARSSRCLRTRRRRSSRRWGRPWSSCCRARCTRTSLRARPTRAPPPPSSRTTTWAACSPT
jgi:hypothetical protein